jgi:hypothetical protein
LQGAVVNTWKQGWLRRLQALQLKHYNKGCLREKINFPHGFKSKYFNIFIYSQIKPPAEMNSSTREAEEEDESCKETGLGGMG